MILARQNRSLNKNKITLPSSLSHAVLRPYLLPHVVYTATGRGPTLGPTLGRARRRPFPRTQPLEGRVDIALGGGQRCGDLVVGDSALQALPPELPTEAKRARLRPLRRRRLDDQRPAPRRLLVVRLRSTAGHLLTAKRVIGL